MPGGPVVLVKITFLVLIEERRWNGIVSPDELVVPVWRFGKGEHFNWGRLRRKRRCQIRERLVRERKIVYRSFKLVRRGK